MTKAKFRPYVLSGSTDRDTLPGKALTLFRRHETPTLAILQAVNELWREIQANMPGTPNVNIVLQADARAHGHFAPGSWHGSAQHELMLSTYSLAIKTNGDSVVKTVSTLLHEAAHAYAHANGIQDTSRQGRWHNKRFAELATSFGCVVEPNAQIGHTTSGISNQALALYAKQIQAINDAVTVYRENPAVIDWVGLGGASAPFMPKPRRAYGSQSVTVICECDNSHRVPRKLAESATIHCDDCDSDYVMI